MDVVIFVICFNYGFSYLPEGTTMKIVSSETLQKEHPDITVEEQEAVRYLDSLEYLQGIYIWFSLPLQEVCRNGFIITWILHQIFMFSNKVKLQAG